jgi:pepF/M3 family oligoendopeptidase
VSEKEAYPQWDLTNVYPSLDSDKFKKDNEKLVNLSEKLKKYLADNHIDPTISPADTPDEKLAEVIAGFIDLLNEALTLAYTLQAYIYSFLSTDSYNNAAKKAISELEPVMIGIDQLGNVIFKGWLGKVGDRLDGIIKLDQTLKDHAFILKETVEQSKYLMSPAEEELAGQLSMSGIIAWSKLQNDIVSQLKWEIEDVDGEVKLLPLTTILNFRNHEDEAVRRRGYEAELAAWKTVETPLAAALNGVKGFQLIVDKRRGRQDFVHESVDFSRIDHETLEAMLAAMKDSFPVVRKYFKSKAQKLGKESLPWWDIFAPMGKMERRFTYPEAQAFVLENFAKFSEDLAEFADTAFKRNWIDVGPREGKGPGAFCMGIPGVRESRILLNFEENLDWVFTLAHELGHGFHDHCLNHLPLLQQDTPMTLAETASIMCETIVNNAALKLAANKQEELAILESALNNDGQLIADIYSRYLFETEVFNRRSRAELSADEFNEIMDWAQAETYGEGLDPNFRQKYMWTWKPHYYRPDLSFYNYPYTFGMLFATGLYAIYQQRGDDFVADYKDLLASTGKGTAADLAARFDIDLRSPAFWEGSLKVVEQRVERYVNL